MGGSSLAFVLGAVIVGGWQVSGPFFGYSEIWQLVINGIESLTEEEVDEFRQCCETRAKAERLDDTREATDAADARASERAAHAAARAGGG